jgi:hypothetical protein
VDVVVTARSIAGAFERSSGLVLSPFFAPSLTKPLSELPATHRHDRKTQVGFELGHPVSRSISRGRKRLSMNDWADASRTDLLCESLELLCLDRFHFVNMNLDHRLRYVACSKHGDVGVLHPRSPAQAADRRRAGTEVGGLQ